MFNEVEGAWWPSGYTRGVVGERIWLLAGYDGKGVPRESVWL